MEKQETTTGIKLHVAPIQYNSIEIWVEKKAEISNSNDSKELRKQVCDECISQAITVMDILKIPFEKDHLLSYFNKEIRDENKKEITIELPQAPPSDFMKIEKSQTNIKKVDVIIPPKIELMAVSGHNPRLETKTETYDGAMDVKNVLKENFIHHEM